MQSSNTNSQCILPPILLVEGELISKNCHSPIFDDLGTNLLLTLAYLAFPIAQSSQGSNFPFNKTFSVCAVAWVIVSDGWPNALWYSLISLVAPFLIKELFFYNSAVPAFLQLSFFCLVPASPIIIESTFGLAYSTDCVSHGNTLTQHTQPSWVLIHQSNTIFIPSCLMTMLFWSSLLRTPPFDSTEVSENRFTLAHLQYLTGSSEYWVIWPSTCLMVAYFLPLIVALVVPFAASIYSALHHKYLLGHLWWNRRLQSLQSKFLG